MNKYQEMLEDLQNARMRTNGVCNKWLPLEVQKNQNEYGHTDVFYDVDTMALQELVDRATPMKVDKPQLVICEEDIKTYGKDAERHLCPKCRRAIFPFHVSDYSKTKFCECCGQTLDWNKD